MEGPEGPAGRRDHRGDAATCAAFNVIPRHQEWDDLFWREFQDPLYHDKGTAADLAAAVRPKLEALLK